MEVERLQNSSSSLRLNVEGEKGVHYFESEAAVGAMVAGEFASLNTQLIKRIIPEFKGFALAIVTLPAVSTNSKLTSDNARELKVTSCSSPHPSFTSSSSPFPSSSSSSSSNSSLLIEWQ